MKEVKVFRDPIYGYVKVYDELIWNLIQTKEFQRLRRIHQLGGTFVIYHTAEHSRFSHSLGVYEVLRRILSEVDDIRNTLSSEERLISLCAALLHDVGHGPYSHAFEYVFNTIHEEYSVKVIIDNTTEVNKVLEEYCKDFSLKVARVIEKKCYKDQCDKTCCNHTIMNSLISSQLDADRLDYLQRDAYNTGARYGEIDLERIIRSFLIYDNKVAFKYTSMHAIEDYLMSRYHMYWQVYFHPVGISYEILLILLFKRVNQLIDNNYLFKSDITMIKRIKEADFSLDTYLELDEPWVIYKIKEWCNEGDSILKDLCNRFLNRKLYKYITCKSQKALEEKYQSLVGLYERNNIDSTYYLYKDTLVKEAYEYYNKDTLYNDPIYLVINSSLKEIAEVSHIVKGINEVGAKTDYKIYYPLEVINNFSQNDKVRFYDIINN